MSTTRPIYYPHPLLSSDMRHVTCNMWHVTCNMWHATCDMQYATYDMSHLQHVTCRTCYMWHLTCKTLTEKSSTLKKLRYSVTVTFVKVTVVLSKVLSRPIQTCINMNIPLYVANNIYYFGRTYVHTNKDTKIQTLDYYVVCLYDVIG